MFDSTVSPALAACYRPSRVLSSVYVLCALVFIFTCTDVRTQQSHSAVAVANCNIRKIEGKFSILVTRSCTRLQSRGINVGDIRSFLIVMYSSPNSRDGGDTVTRVVESARSLDEIFFALSRYGLWDYLNYYLLQTIIEIFASDDDELNSMMKQYQKDLTGHTLTLCIQTYLDATHPISSSDSESSADEVAPALLPQLFKKLTIKIDVNVTDHTLSYVYELWESLANQFALPQPAMIIHKIAKGCLGITWLIPANMVNHVTIMVQKTANMFTKQHVLRVVLEDRCIYPMKMEPCQLETKTSLLETKTTALKRKVCCLSICMYMGVE